jgi:hypothetical protein
METPRDAKRDMAMGRGMVAAKVAEAEDETRQNSNTLDTAVLFPREALKLAAARPYIAKS